MCSECACRKPSWACWRSPPARPSPCTRTRRARSTGAPHPATLCTARCSELRSRSTHLCARRSRLGRYRQQIGEAKHALFHATGQQRLALVATEPGVLAGIDLRNGQIAWRQVLPAGELVTSISQQGKGLLSVSVAAGGAFVRLWSSMGGLVWDAHMPVQLTPGVDSPAPSIASAGSSVIVGWQKALRAFHSGTGELLWEIDSREGSQLAALVEPKPAESTSTAASTTSTAQGLASPSPPLHAYAVDEASGNLELESKQAPMACAALPPCHLSC